MAGLAHLGIGLVFTLIVPDIHPIVLILFSYFLDIVFFGFMFIGLEKMPKADNIAQAPWSHSFFMAVIWSVMIGVIIIILTSSYYHGWIITLLVFSHWIIDFIVSPMEYVFPNDTGHLVHPFGGSAKIGLGVMRTKVGVIAIEGGITFLGLLIFLST